MGKRPFKSMAQAAELYRAAEKHRDVLQLALTDQVRSRDCLFNGVGKVTVLVESAAGVNGKPGDEYEAHCSRLTSPHGGIVVVYWRSWDRRDTNVTAHYLEEWCREAYERGTRTGDPELMAQARLAEAVLRLRNEALNSERERSGAR